MLKVFLLPMRVAYLLLSVQLFYCYFLSDVIKFKQKKKPLFQSCTLVEQT